MPSHEQNLKLSAVGWVKHRWHRVNKQGGFPSTASIASAPYRLAVVSKVEDEAVGGAVERLRAAVSKIPDTAPETPVPGLSATKGWLETSGGPWVYPDSWQLESVAREAGLYRPGRDAEVTGEGRRLLEPVIRDGRRAAQDLRDAMPTEVPLARYLAVVVQDLDNMGLFLSGKVPAQDTKKISVSQNEHRRISRDLLNVAETQRACCLTRNCWACRFTRAGTTCWPSFPPQPRLRPRNGHLIFLVVVGSQCPARHRGHRNASGMEGVIAATMAVAMPSPTAKAWKPPAVLVDDVCAVVAVAVLSSIFEGLRTLEEAGVLLR